MRKEDFKKIIHRELKRVVPDIEILQYLIFANENKLQLEYIVKAILFSKLVKNAAVSKFYILEVLNNWKDLSLKTPDDISLYLKSHCWRVPNYINKSPDKYKYTKEQMESLFTQIQNADL